ncbi:MAG TPA: hypothetical protein VI670_18175 [Thermoanaerobaculia bacterium]|jgi:hypothetical protein
MATTAAQQAMNLLEQQGQAPLMDFVDFTSTLVRDVFRTLVDTSREQIDAYVGMVEALSGGPTQFIANNIGDLDAAALKYLNEVVRPTFTTDPDDYTRTVAGATETFTPTNVTLIPTQVGALTDSFNGVRVDIDADQQPDEITKAIVTTGTSPTVALANLHKFTKAMLERAGRRSFDELQALLRMGLARIVPNKGFIETALTFSIDTRDTSENSSTTTTTSSNAQSANFSFGKENTSQSGVLAKIFGNAVTSKLSISANAAASRSSVQVKVVNEKSTAATNLDIDITGRVHIDFITDFFPLMPAATPATP